MAEQEPSRQILEIVPKIMHVIRTEMRAQAKGSLTIPQLRILVRTSRAKITHKELAEWLGITPATLTRMIDALERKKLVARDTDPNDLRKTFLSSTAQGKALASKYLDQVNAMIASKIDALDKTKKTLLRDGLSVLAQVFEEI